MIKIILLAAAALALAFAGAADAQTIQFFGGSTPTPPASTGNLDFTKAANSPSVAIISL